MKGPTNRLCLTRPIWAIRPLGAGRHTRHPGAQTGPLTYPPKEAGRFEKGGTVNDSNSQCPRCGGDRDLTLGDRVQVLTCRDCEHSVTWIDPEQAERLHREQAAKQVTSGSGRP